MISRINRPDSGNLEHLDEFSTLSTRPRISTLLSHAHDEHASNQFVDRDQIVSEELLSEEESESHLTAASAPVYDAFPSLPTSLSQDTDMSMSPAAMFLSAFSPATSLAPLPDDEGEEIDGYKLGGIIGYGASLLSGALTIHQAAQLLSRLLDALTCRSPTTPLWPGRG